jgi:hypothetical protein
MTNRPKRNKQNIEKISGQAEKKINLEIDQIISAVTLLLETCKDRGLSNLEISHQQYWCILPDEAFALSFPEPDFGVGDLFDDAEVVENIEKLKPGLMGLHLTNIASLLNYLGSRFPSLGPE